MTIKWECVDSGGGVHRPLWRTKIDGGWMYKSIFACRESLSFVPDVVYDLSNVDLGVGAAAEKLELFDWADTQEAVDEPVLITAEILARIIRRMDVDGADKLNVSCRHFLHELVTDLTEEMQWDWSDFNPREFIRECGFA